VVVGDFNGDGISDLAVADQDSASVSILLGKGDGTFHAPLRFFAGSNARSLTVGDFNGDGIPDLAVAYGVGSLYLPDGSVRILLGKGDGSFQLGGNYAVGINPVSVAVGDFNGDGHIDLAVANGSAPSNLVSILLGNGDGSFQTAQNYVAGSVPHSVTVADFNGDGIADLVVADQGSTMVSVLLGKGDGTFGAAQDYDAGRKPASVTVADFNGDGILDLAVAHSTNGGSNLDMVSILLGQGDGSFQPAQNYVVGVQPVFVAVGDFNSDGHLDLAVANKQSGTVTILLGRGGR
jgi:hypothetical protein